MQETEKLRAYLYTDYQINSEQEATQIFSLNFFHSENWKVTLMFVWPCIIDTIIQAAN